MTTVVIKNGEVFTDTCITYPEGAEVAREMAKAGLQYLLDNGKQEDADTFLSSSFIKDYLFNCDNGKFFKPKNTVIMPDGKTIKYVAFAGNPTNVPAMERTINNCENLFDIIDKLEHDDIEAIDNTIELYGENGIDQLPLVSAMNVALVTEDNTYILGRHNINLYRLGWHYITVPASQTVVLGSGQLTQLSDEEKEKVVEQNTAGNYLYGATIHQVDNPVEFIQQASLEDEFTNDTVVSSVVQ